MASSREKVPVPTVILPIGDGRVEITVSDKKIWLSDYASRKARNFTLVIPRTRLKGSDSDRLGAFDLHADPKRAKRTPSKTNAAATKSSRTKVQRAAGHPVPALVHGGPVVVVDE
ncbi:MAG TPA: hypothetical protein VMG60_02540 [Burkholderiaceae bacterium]|nr:hypothetical protein [Burkholderiaceae bacterium]